MDWDRLIPVLFLGGFGGIVLAITAASLREAAAMKRWPIAKGRVLSSKIEEYTDDAGSSGNFGGTRFRMKLFRPVVEYEYDVGGRRFHGNRIAQSPGLNRGGVTDFAQKVADRYPAGAAVDVRFNPRRPEECVLEPRVPGSWVLALIIGLSLIGLAVQQYLK